MKKFWLLLLSLGLVMAFSVPTQAADVKFSGEYYAAGLFLNHVDLREDGPGPFTRSTAFFYQRLRLGIDYVVSPCLRLVTRADIMERTWEPDSPGYYATSATVDRNIDWDIVYVDYTSPIGRWLVGYMPDYAWGTIWGNRTTGPTAGQIKYMLPIGPVILVYDYAKEEENDYFVDNTVSVANDRDYDSHRAGPIFKWKGNNFSGEAAILFIYNEIKQNRTLALNPYQQREGVVNPYFKTKIGRVSLQGELAYLFGHRDYEDGVAWDDPDVSSFSAFLDGDVNFGVASIGFSAAFVQGQDGDDLAPDDDIHYRLTGGRDWDPCLIMFNNTTMNSWVGQYRTWVPAVMEGIYKAGPVGEMRNAWFIQGRASVTPTKKLTFASSVSYAATHRDPVNGLGDDYDSDYGWELDITGTYKITNNLKYMLGGAYFWTGDYFEAGDDSNDLEDNYMIINKLTLSF